MLLVLLAALAAAAPVRADEPTVAQLFDRIEAGGPGDKAAEVLAARKETSEIVAVGLQRLERVRELHARIALGYVLAAHGERKGAEVLVASLDGTGHLGYVYLTRVADVDHGWDESGASAKRWRAWLEGITAEEFRRQVLRTRLPLAVRDGGRAEFQAAAASLVAGVERAKVAAAFHEVATRFPEADVADDARELTNLLSAQAAEDAAWKGASGSGAEAKVAALVYQLRNVKAHPQAPGGPASVFAPPPKGAKPSTSAPADLVKLGAVAVPALLPLLEDRRPIRATAQWRRNPVVLRYQDAALEILVRILPPGPFAVPEADTYLSTLRRAECRAIAEGLRWWAEASRGKSGEELLLASLPRLRTREAVPALRKMAADKKKVPRVLEELNKLYASRSFVMLPLIVELMAELGDTSKVPHVVATLEAGKYTKGAIHEEGDSAAGINAELTARRIRDRFGATASGDPVR